MANWCYTNIQIYTENKEAMEKFYQKLQDWTSVNFMDNGFGLKWLGNIVGNSGIAEIDETGKSSISCRGSIIDMFLLYSHKELQICTETAWAPMLKMWLRLMEEYLPADAKIIYSADEPGCEICATNDNDLEGRYIIDSWDELEGYEASAVSKKELMKILQEILSSKETDIFHLLTMLDESDYSDYISVRQWRYVSPEEWL